MKIDSVTLAAVVGGSVLGPAAFFSGVAIDSRAAEPGDLFVAIKGPHHDGHDFLAQALQKAEGALVSRPLPPGSVPKEKTLIRVADTLSALRTYARYVRETLSLRVVGITGSVGKTTTKEMTAALLERKFSVAKSEGNLNNTIGLPFVLARVPEGTSVAVLEMGMSTPGEIRILSELARPDVGVVTSVAPVHLMNFASLDGILEAKAEILAGMCREAIFVANADDERSLAISRRHLGRVVSYGLTGDPARLLAAATDVVEKGGGTEFLLHLAGETYAAALPLPGRHNVSNFLAAAAVALVLEVPAPQIVEAGLSLAPAKHRGEVLRLSRDVLLYDDSYNCSPAALSAAFSAFEAVATSRRKVAVVGEMLELGARSEELHQAAGREIGPRSDILVGVRGAAAALAAGALRAGAAAETVHLASDVEAAVPLVRSLLRPGDAVFVKGSRGVELDRLVEALRAS